MDVNFWMVYDPYRSALARYHCDRESRQNKLSLITGLPRSDFDSLTNRQLEVAIERAAEGKTWKSQQS